MGKVWKFLKRKTTKVHGGRKCKFCGGPAQYSVVAYSGSSIYVCRSCKEEYGE